MEVLHIQDAVNKLADRLTWRIALKLFWILSFRASGPLTYLLTSFAGFQPYNSWSCISNSTRCIERVHESGISRESFCGVESQDMLEQGVDVQFDLDGRNTYSTEWNLLCDREYLGTIISSAYFLGAVLGLAISSLLFDKFGRLFVLKISQVLSLILNICVIFPQGVEYMMVLRTLLGAAYFISNNGLLMIAVEFVPCNLRAVANVTSAAAWFTGEFLISICAYLIKDWRYIPVFTVGVMCINFVAVFGFLPESPLFLLSNRRDESAAKESLTKLARFYGINETFDSIKLCDNNKTETDDRKMLNIRSSIKEFWEYPVMIKQLFILTYAWMVTSGVYYGFVFSWAKLGKNLYISYTLNGTCGLLSLILLSLYYRCKRRRLAYFMFIVAASFLSAIVPESIGNDTITLSQIACLLGSLVNFAVFSALNLWTQEISPTTHRGKMMSTCSSIGRILSLLGPQASLLFQWNKTVTLVGFSVVSFMSGILMLLLPETSQRAMPSQANEVISRMQQIAIKKQKKSQIISVRL